MLDINRLLEKIKEHGAKRIYLQVPEGLKMQVYSRVAKQIEIMGIEVMVSVEPCYGACDIREHEAKALNCDLIVHIGHTNFGVKTDIPVIYEELRIKTNPIPALEKHWNVLEGKSIGLATTLQYVDSLPKAKEFLESHGKTILIGEGQGTGYPGQILGCNFSSPKSIENDVDIFLFIGTGMFHPVEFAIQTDKPVFSLNLESGEITNMNDEKDKMQRIRFANIEKAKDCENFGLFVSTKPGQMFIEKAIKAKEFLKNKNAWVLVANEITPEKILGMKIDCLVNCACPRIRDDFKQFKMPIINAEDMDRID
ncbi:MAG: diphthamide biosynthesis enzyme Dph2 [Nanoarchaeota archaeon]